MAYDDIRDSLQTGDLILFSGKGPISTGIKLFTASKWSHIGMVISIDGWDSMLLWESTSLSKIKDAIDGKAKQGVQTVLLSDRINGYEGDIALRRLIVKRTPEMVTTMREFRKSVKNRPYEESKIELIKSAYDSIFGSNNEEDLSSLFCSELVAEMYQRMGLLSEEKLSNEYTPSDFGDKKNIQLMGGYLGPEIPLT